MEGINGKRIEAITWPDSREEQGRYINAQRHKVELTYQTIFYGDREENWVIESQNGQETARYNTRYLEAIVWEKK